MSLKNTGQIDRTVLKFLILILIFITGMLFLIFKGQEGGWTNSMLFVMGFSITLTVLILLTAYDQQKYWWAPRLISLILFISITTLVLFISINNIELDKREYLGMLLSIFLVGIPSFLYFLWGSLAGKEITDTNQDMNIGTIFSIITSSLVTLICFVASIAFGSWLLITTLF